MLNKKNFSIREIILFAIFFTLIGLRIFNYIFITAHKFELSETFLSIADLILFVFMIISLFVKNTKAIATLYLIIKTYDGIYHPTKALAAIEYNFDDSWAQIASEVAYVICGILLFAAVVTIVIHELGKYKTFHHIVVNTFTLCAVIASAANVVFTAIDMIFYASNPVVVDITEPIIQTLLFLGVYLVTPLAYPKEEKHY